MQVDVFLNLEGTRHALGRLTDEEGGIAFQYPKISDRLAV